VDVQRRDRKKRWGYGLVYGQLGLWGGAHCGWFLLSQVRRTGPRAPDVCPRGRRGLLERNLFLRGSYLAHTGTGSVYGAQVVQCPDLRAFGNYDPGSGAFASPYGAMPVGRGPGVPGFGIRYLTKDGRAAMMKDSHNPAGAPVWFFMRAECVKALPRAYVGCAGGFDVFGKPSRINATWRRIRAHKVSCDTARDVVSDWAARAGANGGRPRHVRDGLGRRWRCRLKTVHEGDTRIARVKCSHPGGLRVRFSGGG
jgi:hypothetical protein